ncbi:glycosyltransferase [Candidatus Parcubacteria bacterium]|nr:MAG: glycosyltransferase [Candidatus Parcubacteria bacterium]
MHPRLVLASKNSSSFDIKRYSSLNSKIFKAIKTLALKLRGLSVVHISATPKGGGVAELLASQISFENAIGLKSKWFTMEAPSSFFGVTKRLHNLLQGRQGILSQGEKRIYSEVNQQIGKRTPLLFKEIKPNIVIVHDPQPLPMINFLPKETKSIVRLHIDLSTPNPLATEFMRPSLNLYQQVVLSSKVYKQAFVWLPKQKVKIILPAIDPFSEKNKNMESTAAQSIVEQFGINTTKPIITQVSRFDAWKDPLGVIKAYYLAKNKIPNLQLVLAGFLIAQDDPEAVEIFRHVKRHARGDPDIHLFVNLRQLGSVSNDTFINALYTASTIILQKSLREGFGLTITEAMWKKKPVIAGRTIGANLQIKHNKNGILVSSPEETASAIIRLVKDEKRRRKMGELAYRSVCNNFLLPRSILDHLKLYALMGA